jgi:hypothetical protein
MRNSKAVALAIFSFTCASLTICKAMLSDFECVVVSKSTLFSMNTLPMNLKPLYFFPSFVSSSNISSCRVRNIEVSEDVAEINDFNSQTDEDDRCDIIVFSQWMDDHNCPTETDVQKVIDYLCICIAEKRLEHAVSFLRLIRNRSDSWVQHYPRFLNSVEMAMFSNYRDRKLDISGLGL